MKRFTAFLASSLLLCMLVPATTQAVGTNGNYLLNVNRNPRLVANRERLSRNSKLAWSQRKNYARVSALYNNEIARYASNPPSLTVTGTSVDESQSVVRMSKRTLRSETVLPGYGL